MKVYESLGSLVKDYRKWRMLSQEELATSIRLSVRALQRWEANRCRADFGNLHDFSEFTGIPMQVCASLNVGQPVWYSLQKRRYVYSALEAEQLPLYKLFANSEPTTDDSFATHNRITTDKQMSLIHSCHQDVYGDNHILTKDIIKAACGLLPDLNRIAFDRWGHYVGHFLCLPLRIDSYRRLINDEPRLSSLTPEDIHDIISLREGVFLYYSLFAPNASVAYTNMISGIRHLAKVDHRAGFSVVFHSAAIEAQDFFESLGMRKAGGIHNRENENASLSPVMYEISLDDLMNPAKPFGVFRWMIEEFDKRPRQRSLSRTREEPVSQDMPHRSIPETENKRQSMAARKSAFSDPVVVDEVSRASCPNPKCENHGLAQSGSVICNGHYQRKNGSISYRFLCRSCGKSFCSSSGTPFYDLRHPHEKILMAMKLLVKGMSLRSTAEVLGVKLDTVRHWLRMAAENSEKVDAQLLKEMNISSARLSSLWSDVKNNTLQRRASLLKNEKP